MGGLLLVWLACFVASADDALRATAYEPLLVAFARDAGGLPRFVAQKAGLDDPHLPIAPGDAIVAVGGVDLRGAGPARWIAAFARHRGIAVPVAVEFVHDGAPRRTTVTAGSYRAFWPRLVASLTYVLCALYLVFWTRPTRLVDSIVLTNLAAGIFFACTFAGGVVTSRLGILAHVGSLALAAPLALRSVLLFPHGQPPASALARHGPWAFAILSVFDVSRFYGLPLSHAAGALGSAVVGLAYVAVSFAVTARTYARSDAPARRQMRWMILASWLVTVPFVIAVVLTAFDPRFGSLLAIAISGFGVLPIALTIALVRSNLFDVDQLLGSAASYTVVLVVVLAAALWGVPALAGTVQAATGVESGIAQGLLALTLALGLVRLHASLRPGIDRVFFADRWAFEQGVQQLIAELSRCATREDVVATGAERLAAGLHLDVLIVYLDAGEVYAPAVAIGRTAVSTLPRDGALIATVEQGSRVVAADAGGLDPFERAVLETLGVPLVLPIRGMQRLAGLLALGPKRSGDVYTSTERALLASVADKIASELQRFDQAEQLAASDRLQAALRQYVAPGIADRLGRGEAVDLGEREVSVLFSDLRDYTAWAEGRPLEELHDTINRYAEIVARIVREHAGTVVDFAGDGMMAVFGAPDELAAKEHAAVAAARRIVETVRAHAVLSPGVGVATGPAWLGTVRAGEQLHWSALGDTTNLASRLQALTRELDAWIVLDERTWRRAGAEAAAFAACGATPIRGRSEAEPLWVLPIRPPGNPAAPASHRGGRG